MIDKNNIQILESKNNKYNEEFKNLIKTDYLKKIYKYDDRVIGFSFNNEMRYMRNFFRKNVDTGDIHIFFPYKKNKTIYYNNFTISVEDDTFLNSYLFGKMDYYNKINRSKDTFENKKNYIYNFYLNMDEKNENQDIYNYDNIRSTFYFLLDFIKTNNEEESLEFFVDRLNNLLELEEKYGY